MTKANSDYVLVTLPFTRSDYALNENEPLMMHLRHLLGQRAPEGATVQVGDNTEVASLLSEATELIGDLTDPERLLQEMQKILAQVVSVLYVHIIDIVIKLGSHLAALVKERNKVFFFSPDFPVI